MTAVLKTVQNARKPQGKCSNCQVELPAGSPYRYFRPGFRSKAKVRVCMKPECTPRRSQLTSSKLSEAYAAQEDALAEIDNAVGFDDVQSAVDECESRAQGVVDEYEESIESAPMLEDSLRETVDMLQEWIDELSGYSPPEELDPPSEVLVGSEDPNVVTQDEYDQALEEAKEAARDAVNALEL